MKNNRPVQYFSEEYLQSCRSLTPLEILEFLDGFQALHSAHKEPRPPKRRLISLRMPEALLTVLKTKATQEQVGYQTLILRLLLEAVKDRPRR